MYMSLDVSRGNGVRVAAAKAVGDPYTAMLGIGLGGLGIAALKELKRTIYKNIAADNETDVRAGRASPRYSHYDFLAVDSDDIDMPHMPEAGDIGIGGEYFDIMLHHIDVYVASNLERLKQDRTLDWFDFDTRHPYIEVGAGGERQVGRFYMWRRARDLKNAICTRIERIAALTQELTHFNICLFAGLGGGTGGGAFLDVCYIIRDIVRENGWENIVSVLGFFYLPDVMLSSAPYANSSIADYMRKNTCAALRELDRYMGDSPTFTAGYANGFSVSSDKRPVDMCCLVSAVRGNGSLCQNGRDYAIHTTAEFVTNYLAKVLSAGGCGVISLRNITLSMKSWASHQFAWMIPHANYCYAFPGSAKAVVPYRVMATYLASYVYEHMEYARNIVPNAAEMDSFAADTIGTCQFLYRELAKGTYGSPNLDVSRYSAVQLMECAHGSKACYVGLRNECTDWLTKGKDRLEENFNVLSADIAGFDPLDAPASIAGRVFAALTNEVKNPEHGPYYAEAMLSPVNANNLIDYIDGVRKYAENQQCFAERYCSEFEDGSEHHHILAAEEKMRSNFFQRERWKREYVEVYRYWYECRFKCEVFSKMLILLANVRRHLIAMHNNYFAPLCRVMEECRDTFASNRAFFNAQIPTGSDYECEVISVYDPVLKGSLDNAISLGTVTASDGSKRDPGRFTRLMDMFVANTAWIEHPEATAGRILSDFTDNEFKNIMHQSMSTFLAQRFSGLSGQALVNAIQNGVIAPLARHAEAAFDVNRQKYAPEASAEERTIFFVPQSCVEIVDAVKNSADADYCVETDIYDVTAVNLIEGVPLYAYRPMEQYEKEYMTAVFGGK